MALSDQLVAYYSFEENFDEEMHAVNSVPPNANPLRTIREFPFFTLANSVAGKVGKAVNLDDPLSGYLYADENPSLFGMAGKNKTIAFWFKISTIGPLVAKSSEYYIQVGPSTSQLGVHDGGFSGVVTHSKTLVPDQWYFVVVTHNFSQGMVHVRFNDETPEGGALTITPSTAGLQIGASGSEGTTIDELSIWDRILTANEMDQLYNDGDGLSYDEIAADGKAAPCREVECCGDCDF